MAMAKLSGVSTTLAVLIIASTVMAMVQPGLSKDKKAPPAPPKQRHQTTTASPANSPESEDDKYLDSIPKKLKDYVDNCTKNVTPECGGEIVGAMFSTKKVYHKCCHELVQMGIKCHNAIVKVFSGMPDVKEAAGLLKANSKKIFSYCVKVDKKHHHDHHNGPPILP